MFYKTVFLAAVLVMYATASPVLTKTSPPEQLLSIIGIEEPCVRQGGICKPISDCDPDELVQIRGILCPKQSHLNVECCYV